MSDKAAVFIELIEFSAFLLVAALLIMNFLLYDAVAGNATSDVDDADDVDELAEELMAFRAELLALLLSSASLLL